MNRTPHLARSAQPVLDVQQGAFDDRLCAPMPEAEVVPAAGPQVVDGVGQRGLPVPWVQPLEPGGPMDGPGVEIAASLDRRPNEARLPKAMPNASDVPALVQTLQGLDRRQPILAGLQSNCCIEATALGAPAPPLGLQPWVIQDAHHTGPGRGLSTTAPRHLISVQLAQAGARLVDLPTLLQA
ncbi:isochorismatase family protein [Mitsuaria sp. WAJ17]|uniref:cysteine hydrolase family protein n=1 Tax=Mitsuaria sp. WAJ17 TaxID=2761452 RepID=UPI0015FF4C2A|nr:isochorismatase family protein [Mitsuaria sp. WAJ17]MBB2483756.1 isochorismatase family protein [Mitsuaria sp. WAJ17]